ncbi:hypothetical protein [Rhizobacter fulvus]|jgi:hypothetical protein
MSDFEHQIVTIVLDKGLLALVVLLAGYKLNQALEGLKSRLSREQEFARTVNTAVVDLTKKLAAGSHLITWIAWSATQDDDALERDDFIAYDRDMRALLSDLVGLHVALAAVSRRRSEVLEPFAQTIYALDVEMGKARDLHKTADTWKIAHARLILRDCYDRAIAFDKQLNETAIGLLETPDGQALER